MTRASGSFDFEAHWRPTFIYSTVSLSGAEKHDVQLAVSNNRGKTLRYNFQCVNSGGGGSSESLTNGTANATENFTAWSLAACLMETSPGQKQVCSQWPVMGGMRRSLVRYL